MYRRSRTEATDDEPSDSNEDNREAQVMLPWRQKGVNVNLRSLKETHIHCPAQTLLQAVTKMMTEMMMLVRTETGGQGNV